MPNISSKTLFHYTKDLDVIKDILVNGLRSSVIGERIADTKLCYYVPAICFCDIPLSLAGEHFEWYGSYAVGLSLPFAEEQGATPVQYVHTKTKYIHPDAGATEKFFRDYVGTPYLKRLRGDQKKLGSDVRERKVFYDEKEWRIVMGKFDVCKASSLDEIDEEAARRNASGQMKNKYTVAFPMDALKYIIINSEKELPEFIEWIRSTFKDYELLLPKILTVTQIKRDF